MFEWSSSWEIVRYIILLLLLWTVVRFIATSATNILKYFNEQPIKVEPFINGVKYAVSYWTERGGRPYQEDRHQEIKGIGSEDCSLYGVFDGHGGYKAAQYCKDFLLQTIVKDIDFETNPSLAITKSFQKVDDDFSAKAKLQTLTDGTTAVVAIIQNKKVYVGNVGDSRAIIVQKGGKVKVMSIDHRPDRKDEELRIRQLGGKVIYWGRWRVEGILAVSRAIGDVSLKPFVTSEPEIIEKTIESEDEYLVIASDGIYDVMNNNEIAKLILNSFPNKDFLNIAKKLCTEAIIMGSTDNVTALIIDLKRRIVPVDNSIISKNTNTVSSPMSKKIY